MTDETPDNFEKISSLVWCGARPTAPQAAWLIAEGLKTLINLEWEQSDGDVFGAALATIKYLNLKDWEPLPVIAPSLEDKHISAVLAAIGGSDGLCYIHCREGQNRTRVAVAAYQLMRLNIPIDWVLVDLQKHGGLWESPDAAYIRGLVDRKKTF